VDCRFRVGVLGRSICFSDRELEVAAIEGMARGYHPFPVAIYGPEGCGKTTLTRYLVHRLGNEGYLAIYLDALTEVPGKALELSPPIPQHVVEDALRSLSVPLSGVIARYAARVAEALWRRVKMRRGVVVVVDDVYRAVGLGAAERYTKALYEWVSRSAPRHGVKNLLVLLTTSEGVSKRLLARHSYVELYMLWNLPEKGFEEFVEQLNPPHSPSDLYTATGGNPRILIEIARHGWDHERVRRMYRDRIRSAIRSLGIPREKLRELARDPDADPETAAKLEELGLMIELMRSSALGEAPNPDPDLGIGTEWAWQTPLFRTAVLEL